MKGILIGTFLAATGMTAMATDDAKMNVFIDELMQRMTVEEKIGQLNLPVTGDIVTGQAQSSDVAEQIRRGQVGGLFNLKGVDKIREVQRIAVEESRLGIPLLFGMDVIHGYETVFPIPLGLAATWDMEAVGLSAHVAATEASADGINWTFSPMVDVSHDARWGRVSEGSGEDPFLGGEIARAMVIGNQGTKEAQYRTPDQIMACVKHFALYGAPEGGRDYNTVDMSRQRMFNEYFLPYKAAVEAGVGSAMASFNEVEGIPATANRWLMTDILRDKWGFDGFVVTDYTGIAEMIMHGIGDLKEVSARALEAGVDMDMVSEGFTKTLPTSLADGRTNLTYVDQACRRILEAKYKLGLFDDPYRFCDSGRAQREVFSPEHRAQARKVAAESFVLLKNEPITAGASPVLPLAKKGTVAVVGPLANTRTNMAGTWSVAARLDQYHSLYEGLRDALAGKGKVVYAKGSNLTDDERLEKDATMFGRSLERDTRTAQQLIDEALTTVKDADVIIAALGESSEMSGESSSRADIGIPEAQRRLLDALVATGKPVVITLFAGRAMTIGTEAAKVPAVLNVWFGGSEAADAIADVLFGDVNPSGRLPMAFPRSVGQLPMQYNHKNTGRPLDDDKWFTKFRSNYLDVPNTPLYPFGYGLSYTTFSYSPVTLTAAEMDTDGTIEASVTVTNTGSRSGREVVQLYIRDMVGSSTRPVRELKGFRSVMLEPGQSQTVTFPITTEMLSYYNHDLDFVAEPGEFEVFIGADSTTPNAATFTLR